MDEKEKVEFLNQKFISGKLKGKLYLSEIITAVRGIKSRKQKIEALKNNMDRFGLEYLKMTYDKSQVFVITADEIIDAGWFNSNFVDPSQAPINIENEIKRYKSFLTSRPAGPVTKIRALKNFQMIFEGYHIGDIDLTLECMRGRIKGITEKLVRETFPDLLPALEDE